MSFAARRAGTAVSDLAEVVLPLRVMLDVDGLAATTIDASGTYPSAGTDA